MQYQEILEKNSLLKAILPVYNGQAIIGRQFFANNREPAQAA